MKKTITLEMDVPDKSVQRCRLDFPGGVYGDGPRLTFFDSKGSIKLCRSPTTEELILLDDILVVRSVLEE